ncbi:formate hydrogenlyase [Candidatus Methylospira mobilis]|uniref:Formate hydrogenlyase n=1 Tax=Candidatus Methylospira mobilis TaxID=1808979 RepID=A0A5Q0BJY4_9GAMM|nr:formate hydrogenlyase [Candidatus Methylospira mobilis]QFY44123.1 formate hydrogenlyase [Candidatus Methylospira mobilis]WNV06468.1 formate hydrogenlyase [Candidatus Methylospira mobilis]
MNVTLTQHTLHEQAILFIAALIVFISFLMLAQKRLINLVLLFAGQGLLLSLATAIVGYSQSSHHLYGSALITLILKVAIIPAMLFRLIVSLDIEKDAEKVLYPGVIMMIAASLVLFSYYVVLPIAQLSTLATRNTIAVSLAVVLLGMLLMISRRQAVAHVVGFMAIENGLFFAAVASTRGMPLVVELGIAFDVLVAAILFGVFFFHIRSSIESLDVDRLNRLSEVES